MTALEQLRRLWAHAVRADDFLLAGLCAAGDTVPAQAIREYAHVLGADEVWLSRLEGRPSRSAVWPDVASLDETEAMSAAVREGYARYLDELTDDALAADCAYTNSAGQSFVTPVGDILLHVMLHAQYHRGKINLLLRQADAIPAPTDFISWARGVPAARTRLTD